MQKVDLYSLLSAFARSHRSPQIDVGQFVKFLETFAARAASEKPEWKRWTKDTDKHFWAEIGPLTESGKCVMQNVNNRAVVYLPDFIAKEVEAAYANPEKTADAIFPNLDNLNLRMGQSQVRSLGLMDDLPVYLDTPQTTDLPLINIVMPEDLPPVMAMAKQIPDKIIETAIFKCRFYLQGHSNREFFLRRLTTKLQGREQLIREILTQIEKSPTEIVADLHNPGDFSGIFWVHFCALIKNEIRKKNEKLVPDIAVWQAAYVIDIVANYFKNRLAANKAKEVALVELEAKLGYPPYLYSMDDIMGFRNRENEPLTKYFTEDELSAYLSAKTTEVPGDVLPPSLIYRDKDGNQVCIVKQKVLPLCQQFLAEIRAPIKKALTSRWAKMLLSFKEEHAMTHNDAFDEILHQYVKRLSPRLYMLLRDKKTYLLSMELPDTPELEAARLYTPEGEIVPMGVLLALGRKDLYTDAKTTLPFWYQFAAVTALVRFFRNIFNKEDSAAKTGNASADAAKNPGGGHPLREIIMQYQRDIIPAGYTLDSYLEHLENNWHKIIDRDSKKRLRNDVRALVRSRLRRYVSLLHGKSPSKADVDELAVAIMEDTPSLKGLAQKEQLVKYIKIFMIKELFTGKK
jgi:hypothetical protein